MTTRKKSGERAIIRVAVLLAFASVLLVAQAQVLPNGCIAIVHSSSGDPLVVQATATNNCGARARAWIQLLLNNQAYEAIPNQWVLASAESQLMSRHVDAFGTYVYTVTHVEKEANGAPAQPTGTGGVIPVQPTTQGFRGGGIKSNPRAQRYVTPTGSYVNSCRRCGINEESDTFSCICDGNVTSVIFSACPINRYCNSHGHLQCGDC